MIQVNTNLATMRYLILLLALTGCTQLPPPGTPTDTPHVITIPASRGNVTINHLRHMAKTETCSVCHGPGLYGDPEFNKGKAHDMCLDCHYKVVVQGPVACNFCHNTP